MQGRGFGPSRSLPCRSLALCFAGKSLGLFGTQSLSVSFNLSEPHSVPLLH